MGKVTFALFVIALAILALLGVGWAIMTLAITVIAAQVIVILAETIK